MDSYTKRRADHHVEELTPGRLRFGSSLPYAGRLVKGGVGPFGEPYPGRNPLAATRQQQTEDLSAYAKQIQPKGW